MNSLWFDAFVRQFLKILKIEIWIYCVQNDSHDGYEELKALLYSAFGVLLISAIADPVFCLSYLFWDQ